MLDDRNPAVLSYVRTAPAGAHPILVSLNFTAQPQTVHLDLTAAGIAAHGLKLLLASDDLAAFACKDCAQPPTTVNLTLPPTPPSSPRCSSMAFPRILNLTHHQLTTDH